ncbi:hypothetical protein SUGI_0410600 [Cryptomeria japonica]|nr:hypothetical protein SUGI_0410600 [Cryptomeria japonica]
MRSLRSHNAIWRSILLFLVMFFSVCVMCMEYHDPANSRCLSPEIVCSEPLNQCPATIHSKSMIEEPLSFIDTDEEDSVCAVDEEDNGDEEEEEEEEGDSTNHLQIFSDSSDPLAGKVVNVDSFGAKGDGETDDTEAFLNAWKEACSSAPSTFRVPKGKTYIVKQVTFAGPCQSALRVQVSGSIVAPEDPSAWNGSNPRLWLHFKSINDLTVNGGGTIDGRGQKWWAKSCKVNKENPCSSAPTAVTFESINNLRVKNLEVKNSQQIQVAFQKCFSVQARKLRVTAPEHSPNTDGIHITASKDVVIKDSIIGTGDDCISIVSGSVNIKAQNITCGPGHGISIGSLGKGNSEAEVSNIMVDNAYIHDTTNGVRIKTWQGGSGFARTITFRNIYMKNVSNPIIIDQNYCDSDKPCPKEDSAVKISNVTYQSIKGTTPSKEAIKFDCSEAVPCQDISMENIHLDLNSGGTPSSYCSNVKGSTEGDIVPSACF